MTLLPVEESFKGLGKYDKCELLSFLFLGYIPRTLETKTENSKIKAMINQG